MYKITDNRFNDDGFVYDDNNNQVSHLDNEYRNDWNHIEHQAGLNCWIGKLADGSVTTIQTGEWSIHPWGCKEGR